MWVVDLHTHTHTHKRPTVKVERRLRTAAPKDLLCVIMANRCTILSYHPIINRAVSLQVPLFRYLSL